MFIEDWSCHKKLEHNSSPVRRNYDQRMLSVFILRITADWEHSIIDAKGSVWFWVSESLYKSNDLNKALTLSDI